MLIFNVTFSTLSYINLSACSTVDWPLKSLSDFDWVLYKDHWEFPYLLLLSLGEFPIHEKIIPIITCAITCNQFRLAYKLYLTISCMWEQIPWQRRFRTKHAGCLLTFVNSDCCQNINITVTFWVFRFRRMTHWKIAICNNMHRLQKINYKNIYM